MTINLFGFVNDTALFKRSSTPGSYKSINQGACCASDVVNAMFKTPTWIADPRQSRVATSSLIKIASGAEITSDTLRNILTSNNGRLNGTLGFVYDGEQIKDEIALAALSNTDKMSDLFELIEYVAYYQQLNKETGTEHIRTTVDLSQLPIEELKTSLGITDIVGNKFVDTLPSIYLYRTDDGTEANAVFNVRTSVSFSCIIDDIEFNMTLYFSEKEFIESYPISTITDIVMPCIPANLYDLFTIYPDLSTFVSESSKYRNTRINEIIGGGDQTGVHNFETQYIAYPDQVAPTAINISFGIVYKGKKPTNDQVQNALVEELKKLGHSEEEWKRKLPGLVPNKSFFAIPMYDNKWTSSSEDMRHAVADISRVQDIIRRVLGTTYVALIENAQLITMVYSYKYPIIVISSADNPSTYKKIGTVYPDYVGCDVSDSRYTKMSSITQNFAQLFQNALGKAAINEDCSEISSDIRGLWCAARPIDNTIHYVLSRESYETLIG